MDSEPSPQNKHEQRLLKHQSENLSQETKPRKKIFLPILIMIIIILGAGYLIYKYNTAPGGYDKFAKCLTEKNAIMYGAIEWCQYTKQQANMFGKSFKYLNYKNYQQGHDIKTTPTWIINDQRYEGVQSFEKLASLTGCEIQ